MGDDVLAFEYILATVCKLYYKSSFMIEDYLKLFNVKTDEAIDEVMVDNTP